MFLLNGKRFSKRAENLLADESGVFSMFHLREQHDKFISAQAAHGIGAANTSDQSIGDRLQQFVATCVSQRIIDFLEIIEINKHHCQFLPIACRKGNRVGYTVIQEYTVRQVRKEIVLRQVGKLERFCSSGADIAENEYRSVYVS